MLVSESDESSLSLKYRKRPVVLTPVLDAI